MGIQNGQLCDPLKSSHWNKWNSAIFAQLPLFSAAGSNNKPVDYILSVCVIQEFC